MNKFMSAGEGDLYISLKCAGRRIENEFSALSILHF